MLENNYNNYQNNYSQMPQQQALQQMPQQACGQATSPNAVSINIYSPQAFANSQNRDVTTPYSLYGQNQQPNLPLYPQNYNNMIQQAPAMPSNATNMVNQQPQALSETSSEAKPATEESNETKKKTKKVTPLTDDYVKSLENYLNNDNPKIRLIGAKELLERFKEDENRKDNPSLIPLLNKTLKDTSAAVRFLGLTMLQLGYSVGNDETVTLLKQIQTQNTDKQGEDALLASEILLKLASPDLVEREMTPEEIEAQEQKNTSKQDSQTEQANEEGMAA